MAGPLSADVLDSECGAVACSRYQRVHRATWLQAVLSAQAARDWRRTGGIQHTRCMWHSLRYSQTWPVEYQWLCQADSGVGVTD
jgi:hypothetical protein